MSQLFALIVILAILLPLWLRLRRDFVSGLTYAVVVLVACTHLLRIPTPGSLPELSIHRLVVLSLFLFWLHHQRERRVLDVPLARPIFIWAGIAFVSLLTSTDQVASIKRYLEYALEFFLFYFIVSTTVVNRNDALRILRAVGIGLTIVAGLAFVEKYSGFNPVTRFFPFDEADQSPISAVTATYRHRILLGTGMAMAWPLALALNRLAPTGRGRRWSLFAGALIMSACYFANSRGPWIASILAAVLLFLFGSSVPRKQLILVGCLAVLILVLRPGVYETISNRASATVEKDSFKRGTYLYRLELWVVAYSEISKSPWRLMFGYGPGSGANRGVEWTLSFKGKDYEITSWDNDLAYTLFQYGFLGLLATIVIYAAIPLRLFAFARERSGPERDVLVCIAASTIVLFFMMSNVMIFARQLYYLLWAVTAVGFELAASPTTLTASARLAAERVDLPMPDLIGCDQPGSGPP